MADYDVVIIGAGPGGYVAAIRLGQLGKKVALVEKSRLGGVCLNVGCIPSKALIHAAKMVSRVRHAEDMGIKAQVEVDLAKLQDWKQSVVDKLVSGIALLCKKNQVEVLQGEAKFLDANTLEVGAPAGRRVTASSFIVATGSRPIEIPGFKYDGKKVVTSTEALEFKVMPANFVIIGGGVVGLEIGEMCSHLGSKVTYIELLDQILPGVDKELVRIIERALRRYGIEYHTSTKAKRFENGVVHAEGPDGKALEVKADVVLVSVGRRPNTENLGLEKVGVKLSPKGFIEVDQQGRTNVANVFAIGDVIGPPMLAHKASKEGLVAAEAIAGHASARDFASIPGVIFSDPEIATAGLSEEEAKMKGYEVLIGKFPFAALGKAL
ncbi:MAG TPA: dihydrolipoyl dehydrogenase, partial [Thermoplasmata archaeon]|nr:dihydrolipoyl dehydrogenase [Thermoplasmata archaeon]